MQVIENFQISTEESETFQFLGSQIERRDDAKILHKHSYANDLEPLKIDREESTKDPPGIKEFEELRAVAGQLTWIAN